MEEENNEIENDGLEQEEQNEQEEQEGNNENNEADVEIDLPDLYDHIEIVIDPKQQGLRIDKYLKDRIANATRNKLQNGIRLGFILVNGKTVKPNYVVRPGDNIKVTMPKSPNADYVIPENIPLDIRYEDDDLLIVHKPAGMVVHPGTGNYTGTLVNGLSYHFENLPIRKDGANPSPGLIHRIDKNTSGLLVVAKNEYAMTHLAKQFFDHTTYRRYWALVWGEPEKDEGTININVGRHPTRRILMTTFEDEDMGKHAITHYKVIEKMYYVTLVECRLETGRTHQIRVHMKHLGHTLFNDERYGGQNILKGTVYSKYKGFVQNCFKILPRQALHARSLGFIHPTTKEYMQFDADLPEDMAKCLEKWRKYVTAIR